MAFAKFGKGCSFLHKKNSIFIGLHLFSFCLSFLQDFVECIQSACCCFSLSGLPMNSKISLNDLLCKLKISLWAFKSSQECASLFRNICLAMPKPNVTALNKQKAKFLVNTIWRLPVYCVAPDYDFLCMQHCWSFHNCWLYLFTHTSLRLLVFLNLILSISSKLKTPLKNTLSVPLLCLFLRMLEEVVCTHW